MPLFNSMRLINRLSNATLTGNLRSFHVNAVCLKGKDHSWFNKLLMVRKIEPGKDSHSRLLSDSEAVFEMESHLVKPGELENYLKHYENYSQEIMKKAEGYVLVASFKVEIGDQDEIINIWKFTNGYPLASKFQKTIRSDSSLIKLKTEQCKLLRQRQSQFMMSFSFWDPAVPAQRNCYYEMRSYILKPGTMIEWGNSWARGISFRQNKVAGFFSQIGQLYSVHHIWHYDDLQNRKDIREDAWRKPGWDEIVGNTVPLIREMRSRWMVGNSFSPIR